MKNLQSNKVTDGIGARRNVIFFCVSNYNADSIKLRGFLFFQYKERYKKELRISLKLSIIKKKEKVTDLTGGILWGVVRELLKGFCVFCLC